MDLLVAPLVDVTKGVTLGDLLTINETTITFYDTDGTSVRIDPVGSDGGTGNDRNVVSMGESN